MDNLIPSRKWRGWLRTKLTKKSTFAEVAKTAQDSLNVDGPMVEVGIACDIRFITDAEHCVEQVQALVEIIEDNFRKKEYDGIIRTYDLPCHAASQELEEAQGRLLHEEGGER